MDDYARGVADERKRCIQAVLNAWSPHYMASGTCFAALRGIDPDEAEVFNESAQKAMRDLSARQTIFFNKGRQP